MRIFEKLSGRKELKEIKNQIDDVIKNQSIFMETCFAALRSIKMSIESQTGSLNKFLKLNEQFIQNMTKYFNFELSQMEKMAGKEPPEKTEYDSQF